MKYHQRFKLPEMKEDGAEIERFILTKEQADLHNLREDIRARDQLLIFPPRYIEPGEYTRLFVDGRVMMSNTPAELSDHDELLERARGHVLISGLGIGMLIQELTENPLVDFITVLESDERIIRMVAPFYYGIYGYDRLEIIKTDAREWTPPAGARYDTIWHDIWADVSDQNLPEMCRMYFRYRKYQRGPRSFHDMWGRKPSFRMKRLLAAMHRGDRDKVVRLAGKHTRELLGVAL